MFLRKKEGILWGKKRCFLMSKNVFFEVKKSVFLGKKMCC